MIGVELYETMFDLIQQTQPQQTFQGRFQPTSYELKDMVATSTKLLDSMADEDLGNFTEC